MVIGRQIETFAEIFVRTGFRQVYSNYFNIASVVQYHAKFPPFLAQNFAMLSTMSGKDWVCITS